MVYMVFGMSGVLCEACVHGLCGVFICVVHLRAVHEL